MKPPDTNPAQKAGQKRKMLANSTAQSNIHAIAMSPMHKRSKTLGSSGHTQSVRPSTSLPARSPRATLAGSTTLRRSISQKSLQQSLTQQRLDQTQTDYFMLKAHGVDPDTPLIPEAAAQVTARKQKEEEHRQSVNDRVLRRSGSTLDRSRSRSFTPSSPVQPAILMAPPSSVPRSTSTVKPTAPSSSVTDEDPFLRQLREAKEALSTDETWFKAQTSELEKEIEQQEEFRRSLGSQSNASYENSFAASTNGFARSISSYEYKPPELKPGQTLSRTEERIRRTGARGLAGKPIGGTPKPVAMSRRSAQGIQNAQTALHGCKRSIDDVGHVNGNRVGVNVLRQQPTAELAQQVTSKKLKPNGVSMAALEALQGSGALIPFGSDDHDDELDEDAEESESYEDDEREEHLQGTRYQDDHTYEDHGDAYIAALDNYSDEYEGEGLEYEDEEAEEEEEDVQYPHLPAHGFGEEEEEVEVDEQGNTLPPRSRSAATSTPDTGTGVGSTVDAAIELSD